MSRLLERLTGAACCLLAADLLQARLARAAFSWQELASQDRLQQGDLTYYGQQQAQDSYATCSFSENYANTTSLPWTTGITTTLALNAPQLGDLVEGCGLCIMYRGLGGGQGTTPVPTTGWAMGFVNNRCGECKPGDLDQDLSGDGRWRGEWYAVPCSVGASKLRYDFVLKSAYNFALVVSNTRIPVSNVAIQLGGQWLGLARTTTNWWTYQRTGELNWQDQFPLPVRVTSALGDTVEDVITSLDGAFGEQQFPPVPGPVYVSGFISGHGLPELNTPRFKTPPGAIPNIGPIPGAGANGTSNIPTAGWNVSRVLVPTPQPMGTDAEGAAYAAPLVAVADGAQCGGLGGECEVRDACVPGGLCPPHPAKPCLPAPWPNAACLTVGYMCQATAGNLRILTCQPGGAAPATIQLEAAAESQEPLPPGATLLPAQAPVLPYTPSGALSIYGVRNETDLL